MIGMVQRVNINQLPKTVEQNTEQSKKSEIICWLAIVIGV
jgi:hypothetical protein